MAGQAEIDAVPHIRELRVVVDLLGVQGDAGEKRERLVKVLEFERTYQRLAPILEYPAVRCVHRSSPVLPRRIGLTSELAGHERQIVSTSARVEEQTKRTSAPLKWRHAARRWAAKETGD